MDILFITLMKIPLHLSLIINVIITVVAFARHEKYRPSPLFLPRATLPTSLLSL